MLGHFLVMFIFIRVVMPASPRGAGPFFVPRRAGGHGGKGNGSGRAMCSTLCELESQLRAKPRARARVYIDASLHRQLRRTGLGALAAALPGAPHPVVLELGEFQGNTPPECAFWVTYVVYDDGYETPEEWGEPDVGAWDEDARSVAGLWR